MSAQAVLNRGHILQNSISIEDTIKSGGMGIVYRARDKSLGTYVAVKQLPLYNFSREDQQEMIAKFQREAQILASLRHPSIPRVLRYFFENGYYYIVMEFVEGEDLEAILKKSKSGLYWGDVLDWGDQICDILRYLHELNPPVIYRDMKPSNIMLSGNRVYLIDFGIARWLGRSKSTTPLGSEGFAPPEQYRGNSDIRTDVYGLGATLHNLLTNVDPSHVPFKFEDISRFRSDIPAGLNDVIKRAVDPDPARRYKNIKEFKEALMEILEPDRNSGISIVAKAADFFRSIVNLLPKKNSKKEERSPKRDMHYSLEWMEEEHKELIAYFSDDIISSIHSISAAFDDFTACFKAGSYQYSLKALSDVLDIYCHKQKLAENYPLFSKVLWIAGICYLHLSAWDKAHRCFSFSVSYDPTFLPAAISFVYASSKTGPEMIKRKYDGWLNGQGYSAGYSDSSRRFKEFYFSIT